MLVFAYLLIVGGLAVMMSAPIGGAFAVLLGFVLAKHADTRRGRAQVDWLVAVVLLMGLLGMFLGLAVE